MDCIRTRDGLVYAAAWNGSSLKKRTSDLVRTDGGNAAVILSVEGELTGFAFDAAGDLWLTVLTPAGGTLCRARHDSWGASVEQVVTQIDGAPLGALSAVEVGADGKPNMRRTPGINISYAVGRNQAILQMCLVWKSTVLIQRQIVS